MTPLISSQVLNEKQANQDVWQILQDYCETDKPKSPSSPQRVLQRKSLYESPVTARQYNFTAAEQKGLFEPIQFGNAVEGKVHAINYQHFSPEPKRPIRLNPINLELAKKHQLTAFSGLKGSYMQTNRVVMQDYILRNLGPATRRDKNLMLNWAQVTTCFQKRAKEHQIVERQPETYETKEKRVSVHESSICDRQSYQSVDSSENESPLRLGKGRVNFSSCSNRKDKYEYQLIPSQFSNRKTILRQKPQPDLLEQVPSPSATPCFAPSPPVELQAFNITIHEAQEASPRREVASESKIARNPKLDKRAHLARARQLKRIQETLAKEQEILILA